jgi:hypothetical protein
MVFSLSTIGPVRPQVARFTLDFIAEFLIPKAVTVAFQLASECARNPVNFVESDRAKASQLIFMGFHVGYNKGPYPAGAHGQPALRQQRWLL